MINKDMSTQPTDAIEQYDLGDMYVMGNGLPRDLEQAVKWYTESANQGHHGAQVSLGRMYENGVGVPQDYKQAVKWFKKAAEQ